MTVSMDIREVFNLFDTCQIIKTAASDSCRTKKKNSSFAFWHYNHRSISDGYRVITLIIFFNLSSVVKIAKF